MTDRALMPDYLRLLALFGIVVVNVQFMAFPMSEGFDGASRQAPVDGVAVWLVDGLAYLKTYGLFSFMFGVGLAFQMRSAERRHLPFGSLYRNRMIGLLLLGVAHGCLLFIGDILAVYAIVGTVLYFWRGWPVARLVRIGVVLLVIQLLISAAVIALVPSAPSDIADLERQFMTDGSLVETVVFRSIAFTILMPILLIFQGFSALGWFCLGLAAVRSGLIDRPDHPLWQRARRLCLIPGVVLSLGAAALMQWYDERLGEILTIIVAPLATVGYLGLIAAIARPPGPVLSRVLAAGGASLSIYLGQSIVLSTLFAAYGLGLWDAVGPAVAVLMALGVTAVLIGLLIVWRSRFALGPFEWVLRKITRFRVVARSETPVTPGSS